MNKHILIYRAGTNVQKVGLLNSHLFYKHEVTTGTATFFGKPYAKVYCQRAEFALHFF